MVRREETYTGYPERGDDVPDQRIGSEPSGQGRFCDAA